MRWGLGLWLLLVLVLHAWMAGRWLGASPGAAAPRLQVELNQPLQLRPPPALARPRLASALPARPAWRSQGLAQLDPFSADQELPLLPALPTLDAGAAPPATDAAFERHGEPGPEWPPSTRLRYRVEGVFRGPVHGDAEVEWLRQGLQYQVRLRIQIGPSLAPFLRRDLISEGSIGERGIEPARYEERTRLLLGRERPLGFHLEDGWLRFADGRQQAAPPGTQDSASQFVQLAWLLLSGNRPLEAGSQIELPLALPRQLVGWRYELVGAERLDTVLGPLEAWHLRPGGALPAGALHAEVWLAPSARFLPVQFLIAQQGSEPAWVRLTLAEPPLQEAENAASQPSPAPTP